MGSRYITKEEEKMILDDFSKGMNTVQLGKKYNRNDTTIGRLLKRNGLKARNIKVKLREEQVYEAYHLYENKQYTTEQLGKIYNVDANTIANSFRRYGLQVRPNGIIPEPLSHDFFETIDNEAKAYFLGFIMCDGSISDKDYSKSIHIEIQTRDNYLLYQLAELLGLKEDRIHNYSRKTKNGNISNTSKINITSNKMAEDLILKGVSIRKVGNKKIPINVPNDLMRHTLRGMFDADGSVNIEKNHLFLCGYGSMTEEVSNYLFDNLKLNRMPVIYKRQNECPQMLVRTEDINIVLEYLYKDSNFFLKRKNPYYTSD